MHGTTPQGISYILSVQMSKQTDMLNLMGITDSPLEQGTLTVKWRETLHKSGRNARLLHLLANFEIIFFNCTHFSSSYFTLKVKQ